MLNDTIDIFCPQDAPGLLHDARVFKEMVTAVSSGKLICRVIIVPSDFYGSPGDEYGVPEEMGEVGRVALFVEQIFVRNFLGDYEKRLLLANPEWTFPQWQASIAGLIDIILHKSVHSVAQLSPHFPGQHHVRIGFTSLDPCQLVHNYSVFGHYRGKSTLRNTQSLIDIWQRRGDLPPLCIQAYGKDVGFRSPRWFSDGNLHLHLYFERDEQAHFSNVARTGIHLCTSETEGFGHYINEGRAMAALVMILDAPPMNELIDGSTGILVPVARQEQLNFGTRSQADEAEIEAAIDRILSLDPVQRQAMGRNARQSFLEGQGRFGDAVTGLLEQLF